MKAVKLSKKEEERAVELYRRIIVVDMLNASEMNGEYIQKMVSAGVTATGTSITCRHTLHEALQNISELYMLLDKSEEAILATTAEDIEKAKNSGKTSILFAFQNILPIQPLMTRGLDFHLDIRPFNFPKGLLKIFHRLGVRMIQLTYSERNLCGDGCFERTDCGVSNFGVQAIEAMNEQGILIDLSHCGTKTTMEAIELSKDPVVFSHANTRSLYDYIRNKTDEEIKAMAEKGGVIGVNADSVAISKKPNPTVDDLLDHVDYLVKLVGVNHVALGLDLTENWPTAYSAAWSGKSTPPKAPGIDSVDELLNFAKRLVYRGYSDEDIKKIMGANSLRVFRKVFGK
jgi:membrane dipeptidase